NDLRDQKVVQLEKTVAALQAEVQSLKSNGNGNGNGSGNGNSHQANPGNQQYLEQMRRDIDDLKNSQALDQSSWVNKFTFGGYGEMHANFGEAQTKDVFDIHRMVLYVGYDFSDWIKFHSETEIEHAYVSDDSGGELSLEQAYVDFHLSDSFNIRAGRVLTPLGIINKKHEPPYFNGVERPSFSKYVIPTTWASDGAGIFGNLCSSLQYEAYVVGGLDGSEFTANGIRDGRIKERPSLHEPAVTGRLDYFPLTDLAPNSNQDLRFGVSAYWGGLDNGNNGSDPDINGDIHIYSADFEYSVAKWDFRGVIADTQISDARATGIATGENLAREIFG
ncbi:MAG: hypothetical protein GY869_15245, partial [Planctomycetes bacterium]|nr:hypothetical protein [Planctomycetota bacterium]